MQDIAGCRVVVGHVVEQEDFLASLKTDFPEAAVIDRRGKPSHGYRAIHVIAKVSGKRVEIQIRTELQDLWAELSEWASDVIDPTIKYGGGDDLWQAFSAESSELVALLEKWEKKLAKWVDIRVPDHTAQELRAKMREKMEDPRITLITQVFRKGPAAGWEVVRHSIRTVFTDHISRLEELKKIEELKR